MKKINIFDLEKIKRDLYAGQQLNGRVYKQYAQDIEEYLLQLDHFPHQVFQVYLDILNSSYMTQVHGVYHFFKQLYFDFEKLSPVQRYQLKSVINRCLEQPLDNNLELWLLEINQNKF
ncbi:hypothetical protein AS4_27340 [Acinetobacter guillouiae]|uniref:hypothetical protein n=1 Tax=Acinetobacter guillouiae TaxID=106649 RepID=UPI0004EF64C7|nr:hypothetical protein [Acinetobacter guillouiae]BAP37674.1 hypothetical protein AS4_27340 [Acinetobacter guillouiae]